MPMTIQQFVAQAYPDASPEQMAGLQKQLEELTAQSPQQPPKEIKTYDDMDTARRYQEWLQRTGDDLRQIQMNQQQQPPAQATGAPATGPATGTSGVSYDPRAAASLRKAFGGK